MSEKLQLWYCELCKIEGAVRLDPAQDVWGAVQKLRDAHDAAAPECPGNFRRIRIRAPQCTDAEWAELTKDRKDIALPT
jgi:hypothetical protein